MLTYAPRALAVWSALPLLVLGAAGLSVDSLSPDALCPPLEETRTAVAARLGSVELEGTWHASYLLVHRAQGDFVSLNLRDPDGVLRLERDLPVQGGSCATLSRVIALVLERYFLRPEQATPEAPVTVIASSAEPAAGPIPSIAEPATLPLQPAASSAPRPPVSQDTLARATATKPQQYRLSAALWASTSWIAPSLGLARDSAGHYRLAVNAGFDLRGHEARVFEGSASLRRAPLSLECQRDFELGPAVNADLALELLGVVEGAHTNALAQSGGGLRLVPGLGARLGTRFFTQTAAQPFVELTAAWLIRAAAPAFQVGGHEVLTPSALVLGLALGIVTPF